MFGAAAVRKKKQKAQQEAEKGNEPLHPYIKPFGPRFDPNELPYFKYKKALQEAQELSENIAGAAALAAYTAKKVPIIRILVPPLIIDLYLEKQIYILQTSLP